MNRLIEGLKFSEYRLIEGLSCSDLKVLRDSPLKFKHNLTAERTETASKALGTAAHTAVLEPEKLETDYAIWHGERRQGKEWDLFKANNSSRHILKMDELETVQAIADSIRAFAPAARYLSQGKAEVSMQWVDQETGRKCRGRIDWLTTIDGQPVIADLKTAKSVHPFAFGKQSAQLGYHLQLAYYFDGFAAITGQTPRIVILAVENSAPYEPAVFSIPDDVIMQGREEYRRLLTRLDECERENSWPPALEIEEPLSLPSWVYGSGDDDLSGLGLIA